MPLYNERRTLREIVSCFRAAVLGVDQLELIIVDDGSTDGSAVLRQLQEQHPEIIRSIFLDEKQGKGNAIRLAIQAASGDIAIIQDADLEYSPSDYGVVLSPIISGVADVVYGSRFADREQRRVLYFRHTLVNWLLTFMSNFFTNLNLTDVETCYKAFRVEVAKTIPIRSKRFGIEPEITAKFAKRKLRIYEVPISYHGRTYAEGKKITWKDGLQTFFVIIKFWLIDDMFQGNYGQKDLIDMEAAPSTPMDADLCRYMGDLLLEIGSGMQHKAAS